MQFSKLENAKFKCYLVESDLYVKFAGEIFHNRFEDLDLVSISFLEYDWSDEHYCEDLDGIYVLLNDRREYLNACESYHFNEDILNRIPETYDKALLEEIKEIIGFVDEDEQNEVCEEHKKFFKEEEELEYVKATLIDLTIKHARMIAILKKQPGILDLAQTIDHQKKKKGEMKKEIAKLNTEKEEKDRKIKDLEILLQRIPELEKQNKILLEEQQTFKQTFFEK